MRRSLFLGLALATLAAPLAISPAYADRHDAHRGQHAQAPAITVDRAVEIARTQGLVRLQEAKLDDGVWEIEGRMRDNRKIEVDVHATTGAILTVDYQGPAR